MDIRALFVVLILGWSLAGCGKIGSEEIKPTSMYFTMVLHHDSGSDFECYVRVSVKDELGYSIEMEGDDRLTCDGVEMRRQTALGSDYTYYTARLPSRRNTDIVVRYLSGGEEVARGVNRLPEPLNLTRPSAGFSLGKNSALEVRWSAPDPALRDSVRIDLSASYRAQTDEGMESRSVTSTRTTRVDAGTVSLRALDQLDSQIPDDNQPLKLTLTRQRRGQLSGDILGHFDAIQETSVDGRLVR